MCYYWGKKRTSLKCLANIWRGEQLVVDVDVSLIIGIPSKLNLITAVFRASRKLIHFI